MRVCDHPECIEPAEYKAPKSRLSRDNLWFCLEHVRIYNREWDYYKGMSTDEIEADRYCDMTWRRQTTPMGGGRPKGHSHNFLYDDPLDIISDYMPDLANRPNNDQPLPAGMVKFAPHSPEEQALHILQLRSPVAIETIKNTYKEMARKYHPDITGQDITDTTKQQNEKKLKKINSAYHIIKSYLKSQMA